MNKDQVIQAIMFKMPTASWEISTDYNHVDNAYDYLIWKDVVRDKPTYDDLCKWYDESVNTYKASTDYRIERSKHYPKFEEQLDILFHFGYDKWKEQIQKVKDTFPKP